MVGIVVFTLKLGGGFALVVFGAFAAGAGVLHSNNLLLVAGGGQFLCGLGLVVASAGSLTNAKVRKPDAVHSGANRSTNKIGIAKWAELATSQTNAWMNAIRLHESGRYEDACLHYFLDALNCSATHDYSKAALSLNLAADCLKLIGQEALASRTSELAQTFQVGTEIEDRPKTVATLRLDSIGVKSQSYVA
jgi:hypothetical protein